MVTNRFLSLALCTALLSAAPMLAFAQQAPPATPHQAELAHIETYLNGITTAQSDFVMASPDGQQTRGTFYLSRPGKLRFDYSEPKGNLLIADGDYIIFWDAKAKQASNEPISATPAAFLLKPHISLTDGLKVIAYEHAAGVIRVTVVEAKDPGAGSVTVVLGDQPMELRGWSLSDPQGSRTEVSFTGWKFGNALEPSLFKFQDPNAGRRHR